MTRPARTAKQPTAAKQPTRESQKQPQVDPAEPVILMKPRPRVFYALLVLFLIWIGFLVALYFKTVFEKTDVHLQSPSTRVAP